MHIVRAQRHSLTPVLFSMLKGDNFRMNFVYFIMWINLRFMSLWNNIRISLFIAYYQRPSPYHKIHFIIEMYMSVEHPSKICLLDRVGIWVWRRVSFIVVTILLYLQLFCCVFDAFQIVLKNGTHLTLCIRRFSDLSWRLEMMCSLDLNVDWTCYLILDYS